ncbi:hypothetical protein L1987_82629 [Smallanthus sonchifolius]|uniref:Uncharacterized protein n=1 Tax=Smallanthus sonchifolius TaxID=185202 RepID=A0ACB8YBZ3_9ASTR|nr:hypothetical protein L1987_82629 [Smallanthus sonchifolius]
MATSDLEHGSIDMTQESVQRLLDRVAKDHTYANQPPTIYMAPSVLRDVSPSSFNPRVVSIGPLHKEDENVQAFEAQKANYVIDLMHRINPQHEETLKSCVNKAYASMTNIKACYVWTKTYGDDEIAEMMVMDACFILEFILKTSLSFEQPYSGRSLLLASVLHDLVLLENQIPLFFLNAIFQCTASKILDPDISLIGFILPILLTNNLFEVEIETNNISIDRSHHILCLLHECYAPQYYTNPTSTPFSSIQSVVNLDRVGINFKPNQNLTWVMGMEVELSRFPYFFGFWSKPTLRMPILKVHDSTEMLLRNLIAYEQSFQTPNFVTSYATAMDMLVNTEEDVAKLVDSSVIVNHMGSNKEAANMINSICKNVIIGEEFFYKEHWETLNKYCNSYWPKHIAKMRSTYFNSP